MNFFDKIREGLEPSKKRIDENDINKQMDSSRPADNISGSKTNAEYFDTVDPDTGAKFEIPMLNTTDSNYFYRYIEFMKLRDRSPETFEKILSWE